MTVIYKHGCLVPLLGGLAVAGKQVLKKDPDFLISYSPFGDNEKNVTANFPNVPYHLLDSPNYGGFDVNQQVDILSAVCPCAGLSMLSTGSQEQRAGMNKWMIESAKFATGVLKPKVFWGENAPQLYSPAGEGVKNQLMQIARDNGYSFSLYFTNTIYHGIPQYRRRTFYFFWKGDKVPVFSYYATPHKTLADYLAEVPDGLSGQTDEDKKKATEKLATSPPFMFLQDKYNGAGIKQFREHPMAESRQQLTVLQYLIQTNQLEEMQDWCKDRAGFERSYVYVKKLVDKIKAGQGIWDGTPVRFKSDGYFGALISKTVEAVHPSEDRYITPRECMHLMGLPNDFELVTGALNHVCQNVPVCTGADMYREVIAFLEGKRELKQTSFMMQNNHTKKIDKVDTNLLSFI